MEKEENVAIHEAALSADREAKEQKRAERTIAEQARLALRGAQDREARLEEHIRLKPQEATATHEQS
eukprot:7723659-Pyramimonas_sp.AAC.1